MASVLYNPGEPVFDQASGEPYIDEDGNLIEVAPGQVVNAPDGRVLDGDDVTNAAFYRENKFEGETLRDVSIGVPYERLILGSSEPILAMNLIVAEILTRTPGVAAVLGTQILSYDAQTRVFRFRANLLRADGEITTAQLVAQ